MVVVEELYWRISHEIKDIKIRARIVVIFNRVGGFEELVSNVIRLELGSWLVKHLILLVGKGDDGCMPVDLRVGGKVHFFIDVQIKQIKVVKLVINFVSDKMDDVLPGDSTN